MDDVLKNDLIDSIGDAPLRPDDDANALPADTGFGGEVGLSPGSDGILAGDPAINGGGKTRVETGEEPVAGTFDAGGVDAPNTDGALRPN